MMNTPLPKQVCLSLDPPHGGFPFISLSPTKMGFPKNDRPKFLHFRFGGAPPHPPPTAPPPPPQPWFLPPGTFLRLVTLEKASPGAASASALAAPLRCARENLRAKGALKVRPVAVSPWGKNSDLCPTRSSRFERLE